MDVASGESLPSHKVADAQDHALIAASAVNCDTAWGSNTAQGAQQPKPCLWWMRLVEFLVVSVTHL